jgi:hypothetical protein
MIDGGAGKVASSKPEVAATDSIRKFRKTTIPREHMGRAAAPSSDRDHVGSVEPSGSMKSISVKLPDTLDPQFARYRRHGRSVIPSICRWS